MAFRRATSSGFKGFAHQKKQALKASGARRTEYSPGSKTTRASYSPGTSARTASVSRPRPAPAPRQSYSPPAYSPPSYTPPPQTYYPPPQTFSQPFIPQQTFSGGGGGGNIQAFSAPAPAPAPPPPPPPPKRPAALNATDWLQGDSGYQDQMSEYDRAAATFLARIKKEKEQFNLDNDVAVKGNSRNRGVALQDNADDFAARGMMNSGLFDQESQELTGRFNEQDSLLARILQRQIGDADDRLADNRTEIQLGRGNAKRQALARMAAKQALMDQEFDNKMDAYNTRYGL